MGNCFGTQRKVSHFKKRFRLWEHTGIVGLRGNSLKALPERLEQLGDKAKVLDASDNAITDLPEWLISLTFLQKLILNNNRLGRLPPIVGQLRALKLLEASDNQVATLPPELGNLPNLERLSLSKNCLSQLPPAIGRLTSLKVLRVTDNRLQELPDEIGNCRELVELLASNNELTQIPASFGNLVKLKVLDLDQNRISSIPSEVYLKCQALNNLSLHKNPITVAVLEATPGYLEFERRRRQRFDKAISGNVVLSSGFDEGVDRKVA